MDTNHVGKLKIRICRKDFSERRDNFAIAKISTEIGEHVGNSVEERFLKM